MVGPADHPHSSALADLRVSVSAILRAVKRTLLAALFVAAFIEVSGEDIESSALQTTVYIGWFVSLLALGYLFGLRAAAAFAVSYIAVAAVHQAWFYEQPEECDPFCGSPADGVVLVMPVLLVVIAIGAGVTSLVRRLARRRKASAL